MRSSSSSSSSSMVTLSSLPSSCSHGPITAGRWLPARAVTPPLSSNRKVQSDGTLRREGCGGWCGSGPGVPCGWCSEIPPHFSSKGKTDSHARVCAWVVSRLLCADLGWGASRCCVCVRVCWALVVAEMDRAREEYRNAEQWISRCRSVVTRVKWCKRATQLLFLRFPPLFSNNCFIK